MPIPLWKADPPMPIPLWKAANCFIWLFLFSESSPGRVNPSIITSTKLQKRRLCFFLSTPLKKSAISGESITLVRRVSHTFFLVCFFPCISHNTNTNVGGGDSCHFNQRSGDDVRKGVGPSVSRFRGKVGVEGRKSLHERSLEAVKIRLVNANLLVGLGNLVKLLCQLLFVIDNVQKNIETFNQELCRSLFEAGSSKDVFDSWVGREPVLEEGFSEASFVVNVIPGCDGLGVALRAPFALSSECYTK